MTPEERDRLAKLEQQVLSADEDMRELKSDVKTILATLAEAKGGWKTLVLIAGAAGAVGALALKIGMFIGVVR